MKPLLEASQVQPAGWRHQRPGSWWTHLCGFSWLSLKTKGSEIQLKVKKRAPPLRHHHQRCYRLSSSKHLGTFFFSEDRQTKRQTGRQRDRWTDRLAGRNFCAQLQTTDSTEFRPKPPLNRLLPTSSTRWCSQLPDATFKVKAVLPQVTSRGL